MLQLRAMSRRRRNRHGLMSQVVLEPNETNMQYRSSRSRHEPLPLLEQGEIPRRRHTEEAISFPHRKVTRLHRAV